MGGKAFKSMTPRGTPSLLSGDEDESVIDTGDRNEDDVVLVTEIAEDESVSSSLVNSTTWRRTGGINKQTIAERLNTRLRLLLSKLR